MAYNIKHHLQINIKAIALAFDLELNSRTPNASEIALLRSYSGFGGIKCILNDIDNKNGWVKSDLPLYDDVLQLHNVIKEYKGSEYKDYLASLKSSVLTSFYTPGELTDVLANIFICNDIYANKFLEPSAGLGVFANSFRHVQNGGEVLCYEKDLITGLMLKYSFPDSSVVVSGFENIENSRGNFDIISSNIPFGDFNVFDFDLLKSPVKAKNFACRSIHNYFFVKSIDKLRDGGVLAFITSTGVMDSAKNDIIRQHIIKECNLISAVRLPNNLFKDNAGTEVASDLIILQRVFNKKQISDRERLFLQSIQLQNDISCNAYYNSLNNVVFTNSYNGTDLYGKPTQIFLHDKGIAGICTDLDLILSNDFGRYFNRDLYFNNMMQINNNSLEVATPLSNSNAANLFQSVSKVDKTGQLNLFDALPTENKLNVVYNGVNKISTPIKEKNILINKQQLINAQHYSGAIMVHGDLVGILSDFLEGQNSVKFTPIDCPVSLANSFVGLKNSYYQLSSFEERDKIEYPSLRADLNKHYDAITLEYKSLSNSVVQNYFESDSKWHEIICLENIKGNVISKSDIFYQPVAFSNVSDKILSPSELLNQSLGLYGNVNIAYISNNLGLSPNDYCKENYGAIFLNPSTNNWETANEYLSGNIKNKIEAVEIAINNGGLNQQTKEYFDINLLKLNSVLPAKIPFELLDFNLGERWISNEIYSAFATHLFEKQTSVHYLKSSDFFSVSTSLDNPIVTSKFVVRGKARTLYGDKLLEFALLNTTPNLTYTIDDKLYTDSDAILQAQSIINTMRGEFGNWLITQDASIKSALADEYNSMFNCFVKPQAEGNFLTFPGAVFENIKIKEPYESQKQAVWSTLQNFGGCIDHEVGTGKTLTMCLTAHELKRFGLVNKPLIIGLKANIGEIAQTYQKLYPNSKILCPSENDFSSKNRINLLNSIIGIVYSYRTNNLA